MLEVLYSEIFLENLSVYSVQDIGISTEFAHNLGFSQLNATLPGSALRIAQCLGLHKIVDGDNIPMPSTNEWQDYAEREVGKGSGARSWFRIILLSPLLTHATLSRFTIRRVSHPIVIMGTFCLETLLCQPSILTTGS